MSQEKHKQHPYVSMAKPDHNSVPHFIVHVPFKPDRNVLISNGPKALCTTNMLTFDNKNEPTLKEFMDANFPITMDLWVDFEIAESFAGDPAYPLPDTMRRNIDEFVKVLATIMVSKYGHQPEVFVKIVKPGKEDGFEQWERERLTVVRDEIVRLIKLAASGENKTEPTINAVEVK